MLFLSGQRARAPFRQGDAAVNLAMQTNQTAIPATTAKVTLKEKQEMNMQVEFRKIGILTILLSIVLSVGFLLSYRQIIGFLELYFSSDHKLTQNGQRELIAAYYFGMSLLLAIGWGIARAQNESWCAKVKQIFLSEPLCRFTPVRPSPQFMLISSSLVGLILVVNMRYWEQHKSSILYCLFYCKDRGLLDLFVSLALIISIAILGIVVRRLWNQPQITQARVPLSAAYLFIMALFLFYVGEETSWGQDVFRWRTPSIFSGNVENQTNLHNYFNAYFDYGYIALSLVLVIIFVSVWLEFHQHWLTFNRLILPHPSLIGLGLLIAFVSIVWYPEQELLEEMMAVFVLFYSLRIYTCFRAGRLSIET
jgi:hypothetical protein